MPPNSFLMHIVGSNHILNLTVVKNVVDILLSLDQVVILFANRKASKRCRQDRVNVNRILTNKTMAFSQVISHLDWMRDKSFQELRPCFRGLLHLWS